MTITIFGTHTAPRGDFPYDLGYEFERALQARWDVVTNFSFSSTSTAEVSLAADKVADMTVREVHSRLAEVVRDAARAVHWNIWSSPELKQPGGEQQNESSSS